MNTLLNTGEIELLDKGDVNNPVYLLGDNGRFYNTEYKIMGNNPDLLDCYKASLNGQSELLYMTEGLIPLSVLLPQMDEDTFLGIAIKLCESVKSIADNGFLNWQHIDFAKERIFIHPSERSVHFVYFPIEGVYLPPEFMDKEIRSLTASLTKETKDPDSQKMAALRSHVQSGDETLDTYLYFLKELLRSKVSILRDEPKGRLVLFNEEEDHTIVVNKSRFSIGKKVAAVDGVISYSKFVGRVHCQIVNKEGAYYVYDLDSKNGTFVNGIAVEPEKGVLLKDGDRLKIANVKFRVGYEEV